MLSVFVFGFCLGKKKKKMLHRDTVPLGPLTPHLLWQRRRYERRMPEPNPSIGVSCVNRCERAIFWNEAMPVKTVKCWQFCELCVKEVWWDILLGNLDLFTM